MAKAVYGSLPFREQAEFFRRKLNLPTDAWTDVYTQEHDWAFMVAGANLDAIVADFRAAVDKAITGGSTLEDFRKDFDAIVAKHGWDYNGGRNWRSRVIYETNLATSFAAGRWEQLQSAPYWQYEHSDWVEHPRAQHVAWDGMVLAKDDPVWQVIFPPNGWGCQCKVKGLWARDLAQLGKTGPDPSPQLNWQEQVIGKNSPNGPRTVSVPEGIDPGFEYAPGSSLQRAAAQQSLARRATSPAAAAPVPVAPQPLSWPDRQRALGFPYGKGWELEPHEVEFYERFAQLGLHAQPIQRSETFMPTNDFYWAEQGLEIEVKKPKKAQYASASNLISSAVSRAKNHGFVKDCFIIDLGDKTLTEKLRNQLAQYNLRNPGNQIRLLWALAKGVLIEIVLLIDQ